MCIYVSVCVKHMSIGSLRGQKMTLESLVLELQVVVRHLTWVLGAKLRSFARAACPLNS